MRHVLLTAGLVVCPALAYAQQRPVPASLSLADAVAIAREHNPAYRQALNNAGPAGWAARNAFANVFLPTVTASGSLGYSGPGSQRFLTANFSQTVATQSSSYSIALDWELSGQTLTARPLQRAQEHATDADILGAAQLTDTFAVETPQWKLEDLLTMAEAQNPSLQALRARERAAAWGVRAATSSYGPTLSLSAAWAGFTQRYKNIDPILLGQQAQ